MSNFPEVFVEEGLAQPAPAAALYNGSSIIGVFLRGLFPQGAPADLAKLSIGTGTTVITPSPTPAQGCYIRNVSATASVQVTWTPNGGSSAVVQDLAPGAFIAFGQPGAGVAVVTATPGVSSITLQASAAATPVELVLIG